jgi:hypothetical protein
MSANQSAAGFTPRLLAHSTFKSKIVAPTADIDITDWLFNIDELEYNNCTPRSKAHITAGFTHAPDGKRLSINVEFVAGALIVEHYVEDISEKLRCRVQSTSTLLINGDFTMAHVIWELIAERKEGDDHAFSNNVWVHTTKEFEEYMTTHRIPYEQARNSWQTAVDQHDEEETPEFAASIQRKALRQRKKAA